MKKLFIFLTGILLLVLHDSTFAQVKKPQGEKAKLPIEAQKTTYNQDADIALNAIDKKMIPTGILYDRVFPIAGLSTYNTNGNDTTSYSHFLQASAELKNASYRNPNIITPEKLFYYKTSASLGDGVQIGVLDFILNYIDPESDTNAIKYPKKYLAKETYTFIRSKRVTIITALANIANTKDGSILFTWSDDNTSTNLEEFIDNTKVVNNKTIKSLSIDFGDGSGSHDLSHNSSVKIIYQCQGEKFIRITTYYSDGTSTKNISRLIIKGVHFTGDLAGPRLPQYVDSIESEPQTAFLGYENETVASTGKGVVYTYLKSSNGGRSIGSNSKLTNPIIIVDGIDAGNTRSGIHLFNGGLLVDGNRNLGNELTDAGNDVIILDFPVYKIGVDADGQDIRRDGGTDYIERNAMVLVKLIKDVNQKLRTNGSTEQIIVIGPSMGGLVSRYALAYMEKNILPHNCKLYVSFDSPHLGANISIGDQSLLNYLAYTIDDAGVKEILKYNLYSPASRQMLLSHYSGFHDSNSILQQGSPGFRERFKLALNSIGFPQQTRNVAIANGSISGIPTGNPGMTVLDFKYIFRSVATSYLAGKNAITAQVNFTKGYGSSSTVFYAYRRTGSLDGSTAEEHTSHEFCSIDAAPGGTRNTQKDLRDSLPFHDSKKFIGLSLWLELQVNTLFSSHCFIPTISALAINNGNSDFCQPLYTKDLVSSHETPFATYYAPVSKNMDHIAFDAPMVEWLKGEINGVRQMPITNWNLLYPITIEAGVEPICSGTTYKIANLPADATVTWRNDLNYVALNPNGNQATLTKKGSGSTILWADVTSPRGKFTVERQIAVGEAAIGLTGTYTYNSNSTTQYLTYSSSHYGTYTIPPNNTCSNTTTNITVPAGTNLTWRLHPSSATSVSWRSLGNNIQFDFSPNNTGQTVVFEATPSNTCGAGIPLLVGFRQQSNCPPGRSYYKMSFDKANLTVFLSTSEKAAESDSNKIFVSESKIDNSINEMNVYDKAGTLRKSQKFHKAQKAFMNVRSLEPGKYFVEIISGDYKERQQLIIPNKLYK